MKNNKKWLLIVLPISLMILTMVFLDRKPKRWQNLINQEGTTDCVSVKVTAVDSLFKQFASIKTLNIEVDTNVSNLHKVIVRNLIGPEEILNKDWMKTNILGATIQNEGFNVDTIGSKPCDVIIECKLENSFIKLPTGILFKLLYP